MKIIHRSELKLIFLLTVENHGYFFDLFLITRNTAHFSPIHYAALCNNFLLSSRSQQNWKEKSVENLFLHWSPIIEKNN